MDIAPTGHNVLLEALETPEYTSVGGLYLPGKTNKGPKFYRVIEAGPHVPQEIVGITFICPIAVLGSAVDPDGKLFLSAFDLDIFRGFVRDSASEAALDILEERINDDEA